MKELLSALLCGLSVFILGGCSSNLPPDPNQLEVASASVNGPGETQPTRFFVIESGANTFHNVFCDFVTVQRQWETGPNRSTPFHLSSEFKSFQLCSTALDNQQSADSLRPIANLLMRSALSAIPGAAVVDSLDGAKRSARTIPKYRVKLTITEFVPDLSADKAAQERLTSTVGQLVATAAPYVGAAAAPIVGPATGLIVGFDVITGIPTEWSSQEKRGVIAADIEVVDANNGDIVLAFPVAGSFGLEMKQVGKDYSGYYKRSVRSSSPHEALRISMLAAAKHIDEKLSLR